MQREIEIEAPPEDVWDAISSDEGRADWLEDDREVHVDAVEEHRRLTWWWLSEEGVSHVEIELVPAVSGTRVIVTESVPVAFPLTALARSCARARV